MNIIVRIFPALLFKMAAMTTARRSAASASCPLARQTRVSQFLIHSTFVLVQIREQMNHKNTSYT